jgi:tetratricopeptide (TPR) repeat protein
MQLLKGAGSLPAGARQRRRTHTAPLAYRLGVTLGLGLLLLTGTKCVVAQNADGGAAQSAAGQTGGSNASQSERPRMLFLFQRPAGVASRRDDPYTELSATLRNAIDGANRFDIVLYRPEQPSIKRALLEHTIPVSDLVEPIRPEALRHIARAIGARYTLTIKPDFDKQGIKTEMHYDEDLDGENWRTGLTEQINFDALSGKRHLKPSDLIALTVDAICARLNVPSHLAANIKVGPTRVIGQVDPNATTPGKAVQSKSGASGTGGAQTTSQAPEVTRAAAPNSPPPTTPGATTKSAAQPSTQTATGQTVTNQTATGVAPAQPTTQDANGAPPAQLPTPNGANKAVADNQTGTDASGGSTPPSSKTANKKKKTRAVADQNAQTPTGDATGASGSADSPPPPRSAARKSQRGQQPAYAGTPAPPPVATPAPSRPDYIVLAMGARKDGDSSTEITLLRKAVTAAPHDPNPRKQLIQAYMDRHMTDLALAEAQRAIALMPSDSTLQRLYGDALLAKGDNAGALKIYREVVAHDPANVAAQVALADALLADNQYSEALTVYQAAAAADPNSSLPHRRLARVYAGRAAADSSQYQESLKELALARQLTPNGDTDIYLHDYVALMRQMEQRMRDMTDELQNQYQAAVQGTRKLTEVTRAVGDLKERASALADYLDHVPVAVGHEGTHAHYGEGAAMLVQAIGSFRKVLAGNGRVEEAQGPLRVARLDTLHELATANKLLLGTVEPHHAMSDTSIGGGRKPESIQ